MEKLLNKLTATMKSYELVYDFTVNNIMIHKKRINNRDSEKEEAILTIDRIINMILKFKIQMELNFKWEKLYCVCEV